MSVEICRLELGPMANFVYIVADPDGKECAVVDPAWDVPEIVKTIRGRGRRLTRIFLTHNHPDHVNGVGELLKSADVPVHVHRRDAPDLSAFKKNIEPSSGGEKITVGGVEVTLIHTPGHTGGSQCLLVGDSLLTGDTLFIGGCGRVDLPGSDPREMYESLKRVASLPDRTVIYPGHNYSPEASAPLKSEREKNPYLRLCATRPLSDFLRLVGP